MSNLYKAISKNIGSTLASRFRSKPIIKSLENPNSIVSKVIKNTNRAPVFLREPIDNDISRLNFTSWLRVLELRDHEYVDKTIGDLYLIHEMLHMNTMPFGYYPSYDEWSSKMILNEQRVSFLTEVLMFFDIPDLRDHVDLDVIWADRFLDNEHYIGTYQCDPQKARKQLFGLFKSIEYNDKPYKNDMLEKRTSKYNDSDDSWCKIWSESRSDIENHMQEFYKLNDVHTELACVEHQNKEKIIDMHLEWLNKNTKNDILFYDYGKSFYTETTRLNEKYKIQEIPSVLITGANTGIGFEFAKQYINRGWIVYAGVRNLKKNGDLLDVQKNHPRLHIIELDVTDKEHISKIKKQLKGKSLDLLINNAAIKGYFSSGSNFFDNFNYQTVDDVMKTNCFGPFELSKSLFGNIEHSNFKAICNITSELGELDECLNGRSLPYRLSKGALNNLTFTMAGDFKQRGNNTITFGIKPGWVKTNMTGPHAPQRADETVTKMIDLIDKVVHTRKSGEIFNYDSAIIVD